MPGPNSRVVLAAALFAAAAGALPLDTQRRLDPVLFEYGTTAADSAGLYTSNIWFDGDLPKIRVLANDRFAEYQAFSAKHPLYWPAAFGANKALGAAGLDWLNRLRILTAAGAALWAACCFLLMRRLTGRTLDGAIFTALAMASAAATFWWAVPEVFLPGSITILVALLVVATAETRPVGTAAYVAAGAAALSMTVTNWSVGLLASWFGQGRRAAIRTAAATLAIVTALWLLQKPMVPASRYFLLPNSADRKFIMAPEAGGPARITAAFFAHTMVMPRLETVTAHRPEWRGISVQHAGPGSSGPAGAAAVLLWLTVLGIGLSGLAGAADLARTRATVGLALAGQFAIHLVYGSETFLFSLHFLPLLIAAAAFASRTKFRRPALAAAVGLTLLCGLNNRQAFEKAVGVVAGIGAEARGQ